MFLNIERVFGNIGLIMAIFSIFLAEATFNNGTKFISKRSSSQNDIQFDIQSDISVYDITTEGGYVILEAFGSTINQEIISKNMTSSYNKLIWYSFGSPELVLQSTNLNKFIKHYRNGFYIHIDMLTTQHRLKIKNAIKFKYNLDINEIQIQPFIIDDFSCYFRIDCPNEDFVNSINIKGKAYSFNSFPLRVDFKIRNEKEKFCYDNFLGILYKNETDNELIFECSLTKLSKAKKENLLKIDFNSIENTDLKDELFGPANSVYVTRKQLANLASSLYSSLNILEEYEINEEKFSDELINKIIQNIEENKRYEKIPFEVAIKSLSKFSLKDTDPDIIRSVSSNILNINKERNKIEVNKTAEKEFREKNEMGISGKLSGSFGNSFFSIGGSLAIDYVNNNEINWKNMTIDQQLNDLNKESTNNMEWKFEGEKLIPKSLNVAKLIKTKFDQSYTFNKIIRRKYEKLFERKIHLSVNQNKLIKTKTNNDIIRKFNEQEECQANLKELMSQITKIVASQNELKKYVKLQGTKDIETYNGHSNWVNSLAVLPDGNIASGSGDHTIKIWNTKDGSEMKTLKGHTLVVISLAVLADGNLASGSFDKTIKIWNTNDGSVIKTLKGHTDYVYSLAVLPDGNLASGSRDITIKIWNTNYGSEMKTLKGHTNTVVSLAVLADGNLASGSCDKTIIIWNTNDGSVIKTLKGHSNWVYSLAVLPDGNLASGSRDKTIKIWNTNYGSEIKTLKAHTSYVRSLVVLPDGNLASGSFDNTTKIWNTNDGSVIKTLKGHTNTVVSLANLPDGNLASGSADNTIKIWNTILVK